MYFFPYSFHIFRDIAFQSSELSATKSHRTQNITQLCRIPNEIRSRFSTACFQFKVQYSYDRTNKKLSPKSPRRNAAHEQQTNDSTQLFQSELKVLSHGKKGERTPDHLQIAGFSPLAVWPKYFSIPVYDDSNAPMISTE